MNQFNWNNIIVISKITSIVLEHLKLNNAIIG